jgi:hypothetical protein
MEKAKKAMTTIILFFFSCLLIAEEQNNIIDKLGYLTVIREDSTKMANALSSLFPGNYKIYIERTETQYLNIYVKSEPFIIEIEGKQIPEPPNEPPNTAYNYPI